MRILGIETSCDETSASVVDDGQVLLSNVIASSIDLHKEFGGVVPEIAARSHIESMMPVIKESLEVAKTNWEGIDAIAVTQGPGLGGSLLVGVMTARTLAITKNKPLYAINHVAAHPFATFLTETTLPDYKLPSQTLRFPMLALIVSGGHSQLVLYEHAGQYKVLGRTQDDAVGEAFDKVAKILGLPYPGGPSVGEAATDGDPEAYALPKARLQGKYDFSFSGLKTAVLRALQKDIGRDFTFPSKDLAGLLSKAQKANMAASFQHIATETLVDKAALACQEYKPTSFVVAGGVAASPELRKQLKEKLPLEPIYTDMKLCTDNGAMIATAAYHQIQAGLQPVDPYTLDISPSLSM